MKEKTTNIYGVSVLLLTFLFFLTINNVVNAQSVNIDSHAYHDQKHREKKVLIPIKADNSLNIAGSDWVDYTNKTNLLLEKIDVKSFLNYIIFTLDGNQEDGNYFLDYVNVEFKKDKENLIYKVGKKQIIDAKGVSAYLSSLQPKYIDFYKDFKKTRDAFVEARTMRAPGGGGNPTPFACGQPCTNPGFESGNGFWDYWSGDACASSSYDPCNLVAGFATSSHDLTAVADGFDATVGGTILPVVPPGGGNNAMMLGDGPVTGARASRASISFTVSAANANFTYKYAVVLQDPQTGHTDPERPYFKVKVRDAGGNVVACGDYEVMAKPPMTGFIQTSSSSSIWYRNWTTVFIPLNSYIGQCVTVEFTVADCSQGGHFGYAYIDGDCDPLQVVSSSPSICGGGSITLTAPAGGVAYAWTNTAGGTTGIVGPTNGQTAVVNQAGTYNVQITMVSGPACIVNLQITVGSSPLNPVAAFTNTTVCAGAATQFTDTSTPVGSIDAWSWDFNNDGVEDSNVQNPSFTFPGAGSHPVTLTITMGPCNATITQNVTVNPGVAPTITPAGPFCDYAAPINLTASVAGGTWSGTAITNATNGTFDPSIAIIGNNTVTYTVTGACASATTATVVVNAPPVSNAGADVVICSGTPASIGSATVAGNNYSWSPATGLSSASVSNPSITTTNTGTTAIVTNYTLTTIVAATGCQSTDDVTVTVNPQPVLVITNPAGVCSPNTVDITLPAITAGSTGGGTLSYWTNPAATNSLSNPTTVGTSATYYIQAVSGGCSDIEPVTVLINPLPVLAITNPVAVCAPNTVDITAAAVTAGSTGAGVLSYWQNVTATTPLASPNAIATSGTYYIQSTTPAGCVDIDPVVVNINPLPVLAITNPAAVCSPLTIDITAANVTAGSTGSGTLSYWQDINATSSLANPSSISTSGTYYIQSTTAAGCTDIDPVVVTINETPVLVITNPGAVCAPNTVNITAGAVTVGTTGGGNLTYWQDAAGTIPLATPNAVGASGTYYIQSTTVSGCRDIDPVVVTINPLPVLAITNPAPGCSPNTVSITGAAVTAGSTGNGTLSYWLDPSGTIPLANPGSLNASGTYYIQTTTAAGCTDIDPVVVVINLSPLPSFFVDKPKGCPVHCVQFTDLSLIGGVDTIVGWSWNFGDGNVDFVNQNPAHCYSQTGFYDVTLTVTSNHSCSSTLTIPQMIEVYAEPIAEFSHSPNPAFVTDPVITFINQSSPDAIQWFWSFGDGYTLDPFTPNPTHTYPNEQAGAYMVTLSVQNANGCWDSVQHPVAIGPEFTFYIPNAFTPNGDGVNDTFFGDGIGIIEYDIWIFDRWGNMIFHGDHLYDVWDGRANGGSDIAQQDVYVWKVKLKDVFEKKHSYIGSVTLVK
ncbi:MAG: PKD domain-containing protein [Bacteroidia bacterium]|nr:PKD domain-containing protein [Bacteroidia bacterium]